MNKMMRSMHDLTWVTHEVDHVLTLFSGGLDSTYVLHTLKDKGVKVTALVVDVGDGIDYVRLKSLADHYKVNLKVIDAKRDFVYEGVLPAIQGQAKYLGVYPVSSSLTRPIMAKYAVQLATELGCGAIIHTANQSQNSLRRLNGAIERMGYEGFYGTPYEFSAISRADKIKALAASGLVEFSQREVSGDSSLWCREFESGLLDNPEQFNVPEGLYYWSVFNKALQLSQNDDQLAITFVQGIPYAVNNQDMPLIDLVHWINKHAGAYKIGRYSGLEHLEQGEKVLEIREAPAATVLMEAYRHLETAVHDVHLLKNKLAQEQIWCQEAVDGNWGSNLQLAAAAFIASTTHKVSGTVVFKLSHGDFCLCSITAAAPLYLTERDDWEIQVSRSRSQLALGDDQNLPLAKIA